jgi:hypothetical protein
MEIIKSSSPDEAVTASLQLADVQISGRADGKVTCDTFTRQLHSGALTALATSPDHVVTYGV